MAEAWKTLAAGDVKARLSGPELTALQTSQLAAGQSDPLPEVISQVVGEARGYIAAWSGNVLGPAGTLPPQLIGAAAAMAVWELAGRLPTLRGLSRNESRKADYDGAKSLLKDVAAGKFTVEKPTEEGSEELPSAGTASGSDAKLNFP